MNIANVTGIISLNVWTIIFHRYYIKNGQKNGSVNGFLTDGTKSPKEPLVTSHTESKYVFGVDFVKYSYIYSYTSK